VHRQTCARCGQLPTKATGHRFAGRRVAPAARRFDMSLNKNFHRFHILEGVTITADRVSS
jgi:hypothetical protein